MKYSIIIPSLTKTQEHLGVLLECIDSVNKHSVGSELILVDDGSINGLSAIEGVTKYIKHDQNKGIAPSWNDGIKASTGEYVVVINDDIKVPWGWLQGLRVALKDGLEVVGPGVSHQNASEGIIESYKWFPGYCFMMKRSTFDTIGEFDEQFTPFNYEDTDYWTRVLKAGGKLKRNFDVQIDHKEGDVLHTLDYEGVSKVNKEKFIKKWGFDPIPVFYGNEDFDFTT